MNSLMTKEPSSTESVTCIKRDDHIAVVTLNRPLAKNAINKDLAQALHAIVELSLIHI